MAKQDNTPPDAREAELVEEMTLDAMEFIHGKGAEGLLKVLRNSTDTTESLAAAAYKITASAAKKHSKTARVEMDMDMLMGVSTEVIDMLYEVAESANRLPVGTDMQRMKEDTLLKMTVMHGNSIADADGQFTPEQKQQATADLRDYMSDGGTQKAFDYINPRAKQEGLNPYDMMRAGNEAALGAKHPIAASVAEGLQQARGKPSPGGVPLMGRDRAPEQTPPLPTGEGIAPNPDNPLTTREEEPLMQGPPPQMPDPLPTGEGLVPSRLPPAQDPNAEIAPPPERRY